MNNLHRNINVKCADKMRQNWAAIILRNIQKLNGGAKVHSCKVPPFDVLHHIYAFILYIICVFLFTLGM